MYESEFNKGKGKGKGVLRDLMEASILEGGNIGYKKEGGFINTIQDLCAMENLQHGRGTLSYPNGDIFDGEWENDSKHGKGIDRYPDGATQIWHWKMAHFREII